MHTQVDIDELPDIQSELTRPRKLPWFRAAWLEERFTAQRLREARPHNRITVPLTTALFDAFILGEIGTAPEILPLSIFLRFALLTPATLLCWLIDLRRASSRGTGWAAACLILAPTLLAAIESIWTTSPAILTNYQAVPLLLLAVLTCRVSIGQAVFVNVISVALYGFIVLTGRFVPHHLVASLLMTDVSISVATLVFAVRLELRDRQVFLLGLQADIRGEMLARQNRSLARLTQVDALTGLGNRRCFDETLAALWADERLRQDEVSLVMFDIDCFKQFNDSFGHQAGDDCLVTLAQSVARCLRDEADTLVRYGGEEFAVILPATGIAEGCAVAERIRQAVRAAGIAHPGGTPCETVTVSLGVATVVPAAQTPQAMMEMADRCLYDAKRAGRNRVVADGFCPTSPCPERGSDPVFYVASSAARG